MYVVDPIRSLPQRRRCYRWLGYDSTVYTSLVDLWDVGLGPDMKLYRNEKNVNGNGANKQTRLENNITLSLLQTQSGPTVAHAHKCELQTAVSLLL